MKNITDSFTVLKKVSETLIQNLKLWAYKPQIIIQEIVPVHCKICCHSTENIYKNILGNIDMYTRYTRS